LQRLHHRNPVIHDELVAEAVQEQTDVDPLCRRRSHRGHGLGRKMELLRRSAFTLHSLLCLPQCLPAVLLPHLLRGRIQAPVGGQEPGRVGRAHLSFLRAYHCAGRCTDCGACERACPVGINMRTLTKKLKKDCLEEYGWEAGLSLDSRPALDSYNPNDPDEFIK
jgi:formate dehydrogenase subunit beta